MQIGRKGTILLGCLLICIGAVLQAATYSVAQILVGRIVTGAGIGNIAAAVPTYMVTHIRVAPDRIATCADQFPRPKCRSRLKKEDLKFRTSLPF